MPSAIFHLTLTDNYPKNFSIEQGTTFSWLTLVIDVNYSNWQPKGQIRNKYASDGGIVKAEFSFDPLVVGDVELPDGTTTNGTILRPKLTATQTTALDWIESKMSTRSSSSDKIIPGKNVWVYDIELTNIATSEVLRVVQGFVEISPEATR